MAFKIKDGVRIGTVDVFNAAGELLVNAPTASQWLTARTITLGGDLTGNVSIDGSQNVTLTATIASDAVALGTDTTGNYVATIGAAAPGLETASSGLTIVAASGEGTAATIAHADTSTLTGLQGGSGIASITVDGFGHVTAVTTATYLTAEADTLQTVTNRGATTTNAISITNATASTNTTTGALIVTGGVGIGGTLNVGVDLNVTGNTVITGNLTVEGTTTTLNTATLDVEDLNITIAKGAATAAAANGAGLTVDGPAGATLLYASADDSWNFNKLLTASSLQNTPIGTVTRSSGAFTSLTSNGATTFTQGTASTSTATGTVVVTGGVGVSGAIYAGSLQATPVGSVTASTGAFTTLSATGAVTFATTTNNQSYSTTGSATITLSSGGVGSINNMSIGATTRSTGAFTTLAANGDTTITSTTASTSVDTGALTVDGGVGINGAVYAGSIQNTPIGSVTRSSGAFTTLSANGAVTIDTTTNNQSYTTTGAGVITITSGTAGNINNMNIGGTTRGTGAFTTLAANNAVTFTQGTASTNTTTGTLVVTGGVGVSGAIYAGSVQNTPIGSTTPNTGAFTTLSATGNVTFNGANAAISLQPTGTGTVTIAPATAGNIDRMNIGATVRGTGAFTTLAASGDTSITSTTASTSVDTGALTVDGGVGINGAVYAGSIQATPIGSTTASTGAFTTLSATGALTFNTTTNNQSFTTTGAGTITISSGTAGSINNMSIGATTASTGRFTTIESTSTTNATSNSTGAVQINGGVSVDLDIYHSGSHVYATAAGTKVAEERALQTTVATVTTTALDSWSATVYRYARYIVQITDTVTGDIQISEVRVAHNGTTTTMTEYAVLETTGPLAAAFTSDINAGNVRLLVTMSSANSSTVNIVRTLVVV